MSWETKNRSFVLPVTPAVTALRTCTKITLTYYNDNKLKYFNYIN